MTFLGRSTKATAVTLLIALTTTTATRAETTRSNHPSALAKAPKRTTKGKPKRARPSNDANAPERASSNDDAATTEAPRASTTVRGRRAAEAAASAEDDASSGDAKTRGSSASGDAKADGASTHDRAAGAKGDAAARPSSRERAATAKGDDADSAPKRDDGDSAKRRDADDSDTTKRDGDGKSGGKGRFEFGERDKPAESRPASRYAAERPITIAPLFGYSTGGFGVGLGARGGYTVPMGKTPGTGLYVGGTFVYHFGLSAESALVKTSVGFSAFYPGAEVGYDLRPVDNLVVRPYGGAAVVVGTVSGTGLLDTGGSITTTALAIYPGCNLTYDIPSTPAFVGGDARLLVVFGGLTNFGAFLTGGMRF